MGTYKVELTLDGFESTEEADQAAAEYIYESLDSAGACVKVSEYSNVQSVRLTKTQLEQLLEQLENNPESLCIGVSQYTTGIGLATTAQQQNISGEVLEEFDITDYNSW